MDVANDNHDNITGSAIGGTNGDIDILHRLWLNIKPLLTEVNAESFYSFYNYTVIDRDASKRVTTLLLANLDIDNVLTLTLRPSAQNRGRISTYQRRLFRNNSFLSQFPPELCQLRHLQALHLGGRRLTELPPEIGNLSALKKLNLVDNCLTALPPEIGALSALEELLLNNNRLTALPREIGNCTTLSTLWVKHNRLSDLPDAMSALSALHTLDVSGNRLRTLPQPIFNLGALKQLGAGENEITYVPRDIRRLSRLRVLNVSYNCIRYLPSEMGHLSMMKTLYCAGNELTAVASSILTLPQLTCLDLRYNYLLDMSPLVENPKFDEYYREEQRMPTQMQLESFADELCCPPQTTTAKEEKYATSTSRNNFSLICRNTRWWYVDTTRVLGVDGERLAQQWSYLRGVLDANMAESHTRTMDVSSWFSAPLTCVIVALLNGEVAELTSLTPRDCHDFLAHAEQFRLDEPLHLLAVYCRARLAQPSFYQKVKTAAYTFLADVARFFFP